MKKTLRLLITSDCNRNCPGCCNKDWDLKNLPVCQSYEGYDEIMITGGEPLLFDNLENVLWGIRLLNQRKVNGKIFGKNPFIILYTQSDDEYKIVDLIRYELIDGITFTIHDNKGLEDFWQLEKLMVKSCSYCNLSKLSLRLNVFKGVTEFKPVLNWKVQKDMVWIKNCPLPKNEVFMKY